MQAWLYTWNPKNWYWSDLGYAIVCINNGEPYQLRWSCGRTRRIVIGDIFFLMRLGEDPKGIIGYGLIASSPYSDEHWNSDKKQLGESANYTNIIFHGLSDRPIITLEELTATYPQQSWTPQSSGISISDEVATDLRSRLQEQGCLGRDRPVYERSKILEGKERAITTKTYDRSPQARQQSIAAHGYRCTVCRFDFKQVYGDRGETYIEIHHLKPLASIKREHKIDPIEDLRPVCANCHRMLHRSSPPISIEELQKIVVYQQQQISN